MHMYSHVCFGNINIKLGMFVVKLCFQLKKMPSASNLFTSLKSSRDSLRKSKKKPDEKQKYQTDHE